MVIAICVVFGAFFVFLLGAFLITYKNYSFEIEGKKVKVTNRASTLKIFIDDKLYQDYYLPQLISGENFKLNINDKEVNLYCKSDSFGVKLRIEVSVDGKFLSDNGVKIKKK